MIDSARWGEDRIGNNQQHAACNTVDDCIGDPESPHQSKVLLDSTNEVSTYNDIAALAANCLVG